MAHAHLLPLSVPGRATTVHSTMSPPLPTPLRWASASKAPPRRAVSLDSGAAMQDAEFVIARSVARAPIVRLPPHALTKTKAARDGGTLPTPAAGSNTSEAPNTASGVDVFLAGSCNPTTWRRDTAMPMFEQAQIRYYNPQVDEWYEELILEETRAKEAATIILMVIDSATRSIVGINEAVECVCRGRRIILVVQDIKAGTVLEDATVTANELVELNGAREYLRRLARQRGVRLYDDVAVAVAETAACLVEEKSKRLAPESSPPLRTKRRSLNDCRGRSVYLGGNLQSTSWRDTGAIPLFEQAGIPFHNSHSAELQRLLASRYVNHLILFVVSGRSRSIAAMIEAVELICSHLATCLVIEPLEPGCELDDGERLQGRDFKDVARARAYLQEMAERHNVQVFPSLLAAVDDIIKGPFCG